jgi:membrane protease YdiL (CAAX protease family)
MISDANKKAIEAEGLSFILGARIPKVPYVIAEWRREHEDEQIGEVLNLPGALIYLAYGTGLFLLTEEAGWRGALLPRLQHRMPPWQAALVLGVIWAGWHLPLLATPDAGDQGLPLAPFLLLVVTTSVLISGVVSAASGSVVVAAVFHASFDASYSYLGVVGSVPTMIWAAAAITALTAVALAVRTRGRLFLTHADRDVE